MSDSKKRITVYLDLKIDSDRQIWEYLEGKRKTETIRNILSDYVNGNVVTRETKQNDILDEDIDMLQDFIK